MGAARIVADAQGRLTVPDSPTVAFVPGEGEGLAPSKRARQLVDAAIVAAFKGKRRIEWLDVEAGEGARVRYGNAAPPATVNAVRLSRAALVGTLAHEGRGLDEELRAVLDLHAVAVQVRSAKMRLLVVVETREGVAAGLEAPTGSASAGGIRSILEQLPGGAARFGAAFGDVPDAGFGLETASRFGTERLGRAADRVARAFGREGLRLVHESDLRPLTDGTWRTWLLGALGAEGLAVSDALLPSALDEVIRGGVATQAYVAGSRAGRSLVRVARAQGGASGASMHLNVDTGHGVVELHEGPLGGAEGPLLAAELLLRHLGWTEAAAKLPELAAQR